jgi:hypothetical protein
VFPLPIHIYFEIAALAVSLLCWRSLVKSGLRWFIPFLFFIVLIELTGRYLPYVLRQPNAWLYNLSVPFEYLFYSFIFLLHYNRIINKMIVKGFLVLFTAYAIISILFITGIYTFNVHFLIIGSFFMIVFCILYLFELYNAEQEYSIWGYPMFWVTAGILLFNAGEFSYNLLSEYLIDKDIDYTLKIFRSINNKLILVLYSSFIIAFICQRISGTYRKG